jgi:glycosyltransferase involved in cell wall biosynthesis
MDIVFILPSRFISGGVLCTAAIANNMLERGHRVRILYRKPPYTLRNFYKFVADILIHRHGYDGLKTFKGEINSFRNIGDTLFNSKEIIVGAGMWASAQLASIETFSNPKLQYIHGQHIGETVEDANLTMLALRSKMPKVVVASYLKPFVESFGGGEVMNIIHNAIDQDKFYSSVDESERNGIGTIYSGHPSKDPQSILSIIEKISKLDPNLPIRIFSPDRKPKQLKRCMYWRLPPLDKARDIYSRSLVWIIASKSEGFSVPVLEAMACGSAVVATDCGGTRDSIQDGENGFLVEVGNVEQILDRVLLLLKDENIRRRIQTRAQESIKRFNWNDSASKLEDVLYKLI